MMKIIFGQIIIGLILLIEPTLANPPIDNLPLEQQAQALYESGKGREAITLLQQAIDNYKNKQDIIGVAIATRNLALVYQQLGQWQEAEQTISDAINLLSQINNEPQRQSLLAKSLDVKGQIQLSRGQPEAALHSWQQATNIYQKLEDITRFIRSKIYQAQALQALGLYGRAVESLTQIQQEIKDKPDTLTKSKALLSLGDILRRVGRYDESEVALQESLRITEKLQLKQATADTLLSLGNTSRLQQKNEIALDFYQKAIQASSLPDTKIQGNLDRLSLLIAQEERSQVNPLIIEIERSLTQLPPSQTTINSWISLSRNLLKTKKYSVVKYLATAIEQAQTLGDKRSQTEAIGNLGTVYEQKQRYEEAQQLTEKALLIAQEINATDLAYQWQWQLGRILRAKGEEKEAIAAYQSAIKSLQSLRGDLVAISSQVQYSFRENVEPVYREFVELLLQPQANQENIQQAREVIEALQLAQLDNFFRDACLDTKPVQIDRLDPSAAIIYTIILSNRLEIIAALPGKPLRHYTTNLSPVEIEQNLFLSSSVIQSVERSPNLQPLQQLYDWLIRPIEADLKANRIKTLVFVSDGPLRSIPPTIFHDREKYLVEQYNVAIAPSLQLIDPQPLVAQNRELLLAGLTESRQGFIALPGVKSELENIQTSFPAQILLNDSFTESNFDRALNTAPYQLIHLATHGQFSSKAEDTFILTWDERININELNSLIRADKQQIRPIELLVLSACQTAAGDEQAALGLAGMAVRAGARSTIATLWDVSDESTTLLMSYFYQELANPNTPKAEALRRAQLKILQTEKFSHPYFWSAFILVGNWL